MGDSITLVDSAVSTAKVVKELLNRKDIANKANSGGRYRFFVSDEPERFKGMAGKFLGRRLDQVRKAANGI